MAWTYNTPNRKGVLFLKQKNSSTVLTSPEAHLLFTLLVTAYFFSFFFRVSASVVLPSEASRLGLSAGLTGLISSLYYYAYAVMQPLSGVLHDRFGPLRIVACGMLITCLGQAAYVLWPTTSGLALWRLMTGLGLAPMFSGALVYQASAFPKEKYALYSGLTVAAGNLGAVVSVAPLGAALDHWGQWPVFVVLAILSLGMAILLAGFRQKDPLAHSARGGRNNLLSRIPRAFGEIIASPFLRSLALLWSLEVGTLLSLQGLWAVSWYHTAFSCPLPEARRWATLIGFGVMGGTLLAGRLQILPGRRAKVLSLSYGAYALFWLILMGLVAFGSSLVLAGITGFLVGTALGVSTVHFASALNDVVLPDRRGATLGMVNMMVFVAVILFQWGTGVIMNHFPGPEPGTYTHLGFLVAFSFTTILILAGAPFLRNIRDVDS